MRGLIFRMLCAVSRRAPRLRVHNVALRFKPPPPYQDIRMRWHGKGALVVNFSNFRELDLYRYGRYEPHVLRALQAVTPAGGTLVDLGANIGAHATAMSLHVGPRGRVLAVEPHPGVLTRLRQNVAASPHYANIEIIPVAVSEAAGTLPFYYPRDSAEWTRGRFKKAPGEDWESTMVPVTTLDSLLKERGWPRIDTIKCDVEGFDVAALRGAQETIMRFQPSVVFEFVRRLWRLSGFKFEDLVAALPGYQFQLIPRRAFALSDLANFQHIHSFEELHPLKQRQYELLASVAKA